MHLERGLTIRLVSVMEMIRLIVANMVAFLRGLLQIKFALKVGFCRLVQNGRH